MVTVTLGHKIIIITLIAAILWTVAFLLVGWWALLALPLGGFALMIHALRG